MDFFFKKRPALTSLISIAGHNGLLKSEAVSTNSRGFFFAMSNAFFDKPQTMQ